MATMTARVVTPEREVWSGEATLVVARGIGGEIGILPGHTPVLFALDIGVLTIEQRPGERLAAAVDGGFMHVDTAEGLTQVDVLAEHAELAKDVDVEQARRQKERAERMLAERETVEARTELAQALARLHVGGRGH